jgi:dTDP-4-dehydrorhamnose reductase
MTRSIKGSSTGALELWGGIECTMNRVQDKYFSQLERNGHASRADDLDGVAALGIRALRYPILWEGTAPNGIAQANWSWPDERLGRLLKLGVTPIVGLVHHGSGPAHTSLVDPEFPSKLAEYASAVAKRYPWIEYYTPVNEPLTTARFSGLYGLWYPHGLSEKTFKDALFTQCRAVVSAMRAIRCINPTAKLVQTEDLGKTYSTPLLAYQALFNNELRWLAWDLLCGRVTPDHQLWKWLNECCGASPSELLWFVRNTCAPDIIGANHYITSVRFLDDNLNNYPSRYHGGNGQHRYADIEAARCLASGTGGIEPLLREAWERYRLPLAVTEAHIDSTRDDQMRWLAEIWRAAMQAKGYGVDIRAVTVWALFGSYDWNCLVTECRGYYEPGAFDVRGAQPRPTAIAALMRDLAAGQLPQHPVLVGPGWWNRPERFHCPPVTLPSASVEDQPKPSNKVAPLLVSGATGTLGGAFAHLCKERGLNYRLMSRNDMDIADANSIENTMARYDPWAVINAAGYVRVDDAEKDIERCFRENTLGPTNLAAICARENIPLVTFSTDLVFDGTQKSPYIETDPTAPLNVYGRSKAEAEMRVLERHPGSLVIRTSSFFGPWDEYNYITVLLRRLRDGLPFLAANDLTVSPTYVPDLVNACLDLLIDREVGIWHLSNGLAITWADLARWAAELAQVDSSLLRVCHSEELRFAARRPVYSALGSNRSFLMPPLDDALGRYFCQCAVDTGNSGRE